MKHMEGIMLGLLMAAATAVMGSILAVGQTEDTSRQSQSKMTQKSNHTATPDRGQQVFDQNCSRCHNAPQGFSPSISGTVALHMRVRAGLSDADYRALLHFLNP